MLIGVGTRDETPQNSGCMAALKSNYLRTKNSEDGLLNLYFTRIFFGKINFNQRKEILATGSFFTVEYDQETIYYKASSLYENLDQMLDKIIECSLQPKTFISKVII